MHAYIVQCTVSVNSKKNCLYKKPDCRMNLSCNCVILSTNRQVK